MLIGKLSKVTGLSRDTIRYYERIGLLAPLGTTGSTTYKNYGPDCVARLNDIARLKRTGFTLREIRALASGPVACAGLPARVSDKLKAVEIQIEELRKFQSELKQVAAACAGGCDSTRGFPDCVLPSEKEGCC